MARMRLILLTALTMIAFAANSVLNRMALAGDEIGPMAFAALRLASGALALAVLVWLRDRRVRLFGPRRSVGVASLFVYMVGFSAAYVALPAGLGALILFGGVQVTMFAGAVLGGERVPPARWAGAALALVGLGWLMWPEGADAPPLVFAALMGAAAVGWGVYSLAGRRAGEPLAATAANFVLAAPVAVALALAVPEGGASVRGMALAVVSGVVTSGLGYALWYTVLPRLEASVAALAQLTVPVIALAGGVALLGEALTLRFAVAAVLVLGGVALGVLAPQRTRSSSGS
ncbi:Threonine/homoserine efflux transporter RhtA [Tranquillimonas alkanivorans]|uniref:Threonine/homoserine efflux transporter RhtA n=2 Tax=Tranquillimonas alkanivorans TaxID=441119 RepID=A0A1I5NCY5_9RHOB|nr:Threonine/homoserine efflux transporter RhtA [Tranquillimonas alkanivorans]